MMEATINFIYMNQAVLKTGSKQYLVAEGAKIKVEKLPVEAGKTVKFEEILLTTTDKETNIGVPILKGASVTGKVLRHGRAEKVTGVKMKSKKRHKKYFGHKQHFTEVEITKIVVG